MDNLDTVVQEALKLFAGIDDAAQLEQVKARYLGKSGALTDLQKRLGSLPAAERPAMGARFNAAKEQLEAALAAQRDKIRAESSTLNSRRKRSTSRCPAAVSAAAACTRSRARWSA